MNRTVPLVAALLLSAGLAHADVTGDVIAELQAQGYTNIEVRVSATRIKVEAMLNGQKLERVLDASSGAVLTEETGPAGSGSGGSGVEVADDTHGGGSSDDSSDTAEGDDDHGGSAGDDSHEGSDDHGGDNDHESDAGDSD